MSLQFQIEAGGSTVPAGAFRATFVDVEPTEHEEFGAGLRFIFKVVGGGHYGEDATRITSDRPTPKNAAGRMIAGITGSGLTPGMQVDLVSHVGKEFLIQVEETKNGSTRIGAVIRADA